MCKYIKIHTNINAYNIYTYAYNIHQHLKMLTFRNDQRFYKNKDAEYIEYFVVRKHKS